MLCGFASFDTKYETLKEASEDLLLSSVIFLFFFFKYVEYSWLETSAEEIVEICTHILGA